jgi:hypothetical protein
MIYTFTGDNKVVEPDPLSEGFARYAESNMEHYVFEFLLNYVRRMKWDLDWRKLLKKNPEKPFLLFVTLGHCVHSITDQEWEGDVEPGYKTTRESDTDREESTAIIHQRRRTEKSEWQDGMER